MKYALLSYHTTRRQEIAHEWRARLDETLRNSGFEIDLGTYIIDLDSHEHELYRACFILESHNCAFCVVQFSDPDFCMVVTNKGFQKLSDMGLKNESFPVRRSIFQRECWLLN